MDDFVGFFGWCRNRIGRGDCKLWLGGGDATASLFTTAGASSAFREASSAISLPLQLPQTRGFLRYNI